MKLDKNKLSKEITEHFLPDGSYALLDKNNKLVAYNKYGLHSVLEFNWVRSDFTKETKR